MDRGSESPPAALDPVPAYPRSAVEEYLADARRAEAHLRGLLAEAEARQARASAALEAADESHRILGQMMVEAQQDLAARREHAEQAAADLLARAEGEAQRILAAGRGQVALTLGLPSEPQATCTAAPIEATANGDRDDPPPPPAPTSVVDVRPPPPAFHLAPERSVPTPATTAARSDLDPTGRRWRPRWLRASETGWPYNAASEDESYFTRLCDELRADGSAGAWVETA
ncbi:hypothetical protein BH10ACT1_BH10ACT1_05390 [soil metagenome]